MRGTEISEADRTQALQFLELITNKNPHFNLPSFTIRREDLVDLLGWYGRIRAGGKEATGEVYSRDKEAVQG